MLDLDAPRLNRAGGQTEQRPGELVAAIRMHAEAPLQARGQLAGEARGQRARQLSSVGATPRAASRDYITAFEDAGLTLLKERAMTPFLRLFVLGRSAGDNAS